MGKSCEDIVMENKIKWFQTWKDAQYHFSGDNYKFKLL